MKVGAEIIKELKEGPSAPPDGEEHFAEASERSRRILRNVILHNIPEGNSGNKHTHDLNMIAKIYTSLDL